ncbi:hypothetical protein [Xanthobacter wiegelii]|uniref:hypothetical protein n=1 Tax=Xanthobacter wiegelii TaxID=3119913 RepID=UPI0037291D79
MRGLSDFLLKVVEYFTIIGALKYFSVKSGSSSLNYLTYFAIAALQMYFIGIMLSFRIQIFQPKNPQKWAYFANFAISVMSIFSILSALMILANRIVDELAAVQAM